MVHAGADSDGTDSEEDATQLSPLSSKKKASRASMTKVRGKKKKTGMDTPWLTTMKDNISDFMPLEDGKHVVVKIPP